VTAQWEPYRKFVYSDGQLLVGGVVRNADNDYGHFDLVLGIDATRDLTSEFLVSRFTGTDLFVCGYLDETGDRWKVRWNVPEQILVALHHWARSNGVVLVPAAEQ
jgi:hypothetical protein